MQGKIIPMQSIFRNVNATPAADTEAVLDEFHKHLPPFEVGRSPFPQGLSFSRLCRVAAAASEASSITASSSRSDLLVVLGGK